MMLLLVSILVSILCIFAFSNCSPRLYFDYKVLKTCIEVDTLNRDIFIDLWESLKDPSEPSNTKHKTVSKDKRTIDHVVMSKICNFTPEFIQRVGNFSLFPGQEVTDISIDGEVRTPSDHLGLYSVIRVSE